MKTARSNKDKKKNLLYKFKQNIKTVKCTGRWYTYIFKALNSCSLMQDKPYRAEIINTFKSTFYPNSPVDLLVQRNKLERLAYMTALWLQGPEVLGCLLFHSPPSHSPGSQFLRAPLPLEWESEQQFPAQAGGTHHLGHEREQQTWCWELGHIRHDNQWPCEVTFVTCLSRLHCFCTQDHFHAARNATTRQLSLRLLNANLGRERILSISRMSPNLKLLQKLSC